MEDLYLSSSEVSQPKPLELPIENTPRIVHFSIGSPLIEGTSVIPITLVGNISCIGFFVSKEKELPEKPKWERFPQQQLDLGA